MVTLSRLRWLTDQDFATWQTETLGSIERCGLPAIDGKFACNAHLASLTETPAKAQKHEAQNNQKAKTQEEGHPR